MKKICFVFLFIMMFSLAFAREESEDFTNPNQFLENIQVQNDSALIVTLPAVYDISHSLIFHLNPLTDRVFIDFICGNKIKTIQYNNVINTPDVTFYFSALGFIPEKIRIRPDLESLEYSISPENILSCIELKSFDKFIQPPLDPIPGDCWQILNNKPEGWRFSDWEVFVWESFPGIIFFDTLNYGIQTNIFKRLAFFMEKKGYTGKIHSFRDISGKSDWNGHNYLSQDMAAFFTMAQRKKIILTSGEVYLRNLLLANNIIRRTGEGFSGNDYTGVVSISQESGEYLRGLLLTHEGFHGLYYAVEELRDMMAAGWGNLIPEAQKIWIDYLRTQKGWNYNYEDYYLVKNELFGYMMQQADFGEYFDKFLFPRIIKNCENEALYYSNSRESIRKSFVELSEQLNRYLKSNLNLEAGNLLHMVEIKK